MNSLKVPVPGIVYYFVLIVRYSEHGGGSDGGEDERRFQETGDERRNCVWRLSSSTRRQWLTAQNVFYIKLCFPSCDHTAVGRLFSGR